MTRKTSSRTRFASIFLALALVMNLVPFSAFATKAENGTGDANAELTSVNDQVSDENAENTDKANGEVSDENAANTNAANTNANAASGVDGESVSEPVASYTVSIALPEEGVALRGGQSDELLTQTVSAGSAIADIRLVSAYEDEPFDESYADAFNAKLFNGTGLTATFSEDGIITISGAPTANVAVNLANAFAGDEPAEVADNTAVYVATATATATATDSYTSPLGNDSTGDGSTEKPYATISKAYSAVADGGTIYLLSDVNVSSQITFGTAKTVTITSAESNNAKTIYSKIAFGYDNKTMMTVTAGEVIFKNITIDGTGQRQAATTSFPNGIANSPGCIYVTKGGATATLDAGTTIQNFWKNNGTSGGSSVLKATITDAQINIRDGVLITGCVLEAGNKGDPSSVISSGTGGIVYMTGGTVSGNALSTTQSASTAIVNIGMISNPHFWMTGGAISGNTINNGAAAVYMRGEASACDMQFGDTAYVYENYVSGTSGDQRNIYLKNDKDGEENSNVYVKLCSALTGNAKLGVYAEKIGVATKVAQGGGVSGVGNGAYTATAEDTTYFVSDKATDAEILYCGGDDKTCGLLQHRTDTTHEKAIYLSFSPAVTATKSTTNTDQINLSIARCTTDATYVVLDKDMKPVTDKNLTNGSYVSNGNGTFTLNSDASTTTIEMPGLDKANGPYTVMLVGTGGLTVDSITGKASTSNLTDIATVNIVNFAGEGVKWSDGTTDFENGDFDIVTVPHNDQTGKATKTYTATTKANYTFATDNAITASGNLNTDATATDGTDGSKAIAVEVPAYGTTEKGTKGYSTVTLTGSAEKGDGKITIGVDKVTADSEDNVGTLSESLTVTLHITDNNTYASTPTYKYAVTNGRTTADGNEITGNVAATTDGDGNTAYAISGLKYGDHVKVYVDGEEGVSPAYFKVLNTTLENGSFENISSKTGDENSQRKTGIDIAAWRTSANDQNMEVYPNPTTTYNVDKVPDGGYVAELNATEASSLYQEVSTTPGSTLGWTLEHTARGNAGAGTQKMAIVIGPTLDAGDTDPYKKSSTTTSDMFMTIAAQIQNPVVGETYYTTYKNKTYQVTIASDTRSGRSWKNYMGTYTVPDGQTETVFAFASLDTSGDNAKLGNLIDDVGFGAGVAITEAAASKNKGDDSKIDISIENSTKNGVYVVLDKDMKPVKGTLTNGTYVDSTTGTFKLTDADTATTTTVSMAALDKTSGPYTVMRVLSGTLSVGSDGKASTTNLTDIATVNVVNFAGEGVSWSDGTTNFKNGDFDIVTVPHDDQTGKATKTYTATAKNGYALAAENAVTAKGNLNTASVSDSTDGGKTIAVEVPAYGTTSKGTTNYNTVTLTGATTISTGVKLLDKTGGTEMTATGGVASKTYDGVPVAHTAGSVDGATLSYTWQKKNASGDGYTDITDNAAPSDAGEYNLKITATKTDATTVLGAEDLPFTISPKTLTVSVTAQDKEYDGGTTATLKDATLNGVLSADKDEVTLVASSVSAAFGDKKVGAGKSVTLTGSYTLSGTAAGNYTVAQPTGLAANITAKEVTISGLSASKTYDGDDTAEKSEIKGTAVVGNKAVDGDDVSLNTDKMAGTFNSANVGEATTITLTGLSLTGNDAANYKLPETVTCTGTITKADGNGTVTLEGWTYGETAKGPQPTSNTNGTASVTYQYKGKDANDNTYSDTVPTKAGDYTVKATFSATNNYNAVAATYDFTIAAKELTISGTAIETSKVYDGNNSAKVTSNGELTGVLTGDTVTIKAGTATYNDKTAGENKTVAFSGFEIEGADAGNYTLKEQPATTSAAITKREVSVSGLTATKTYDGDITAEKSEISGTPVVGNKAAEGDNVSVNTENMKGTFNSANVNEAKTVTVSDLSLTGTDAANYKLPETVTCTGAITAASLAIKGATVTAKTYDGSDVATITGVAFDGLKNGETLAANTDYAVSNAKYDHVNATGGDAATKVDFKVALANTDVAKNYTLATDAGSQSATIGKASHDNNALSTKGNRGEANEFSVPSAYVVAGGTVGTVATDDKSGIIDGIPAYDSANGKLTYALKSAATEGQTATVTLPVTSTNYNDYSIVVTVGVTAKENVKIGIAGKNYEYDGTAQAPTDITVTDNKVQKNALEVSYEGTDGTTYSKSATAPTNAGKYIMTVKVPDSNNKYTGSATCAFEIAKKPLTATIAAENKIYDGKTSATVTPTLEGVVGNDDVVANVANPTFADKNAGTDKKVTAAITLDGAAAGNYTVNATAETKATISAKEVSIAGVAVAGSKTYDKSTAATITSNGTIDGKVETDNLTITAGQAAYDNASVGTGKTVSFTGFALAGTDANNYKLKAQPASTTANITVKALTLTIKANDKKLDGSDVAVLDTKNATFDGMVSGDTVSVDSAKGAFENCNTASDTAVVKVTDVKLKGDDAGNYEIAKINSVTAKLIPLSVTFMDGDAKLGEKTISVYGTAPAEVVSPEKSCYYFAGWYTDEECTTPWNSKTGVTADATVYAKWSTDALYTLSGVVKQGDAAKSDVSVTLYEGSAGIAATTTDGNGRYSFGNVPNGTYTIAAKASDRAATTTVTVHDGNTTQDIVLPATAVATEVQVAPGAPAATVSGIDEALVNALIASDGNGITALADGERLEVKLNVKADASAAEKAAIEKMESDNISWDFVNMDVDWSKYNLDGHIGSGNIADTVNVLAIRVPYETNDKRDIVVYRHHMNGTTAEVTQFTQLQSEPDEASYADGTCYVGDGYIVLYTQKFSAFGIGYINDATDPVISGAEDGKTYCGPVTLTITDEEIAQVTVNGKEVSLDADGRLTLNAADGEQTVVAVDAARHSSSITVTVNDGHTWGAWVSNGDGTHSRVCAVDATHTETADCSGGVATCKDKAVCDICGEAYGEVDSSNHANLKHVDAKAATTDAEGNIEYWYCEDCDTYFKDANATEEIAKADTVTAKLTKEPAKADTETTEPTKEAAKADTASAKSKSASTSNASASTSRTAAKTGDEVPVIPWAALLLVSGGAGALAALVGRKRKRDR